MHIEALEGCEIRVLEQIDGITSKMKEQLQCRKKAYPGQSEAERWTDIYRILFPNEEAPSPCKFMLDEAILYLEEQLKSL